MIQAVGEDGRWRKYILLYSIIAYTIVHDGHVRIMLQVSVGYPASGLEMRAKTQPLRGVNRPGCGWGTLFACYTGGQ